MNTGPFKNLRDSRATLLQTLFFCMENRVVIHLCSVSTANGTRITNFKDNEDILVNIYPEPFFCVKCDHVIGHAGSKLKFR